VLCRQTMAPLPQESMQPRPALVMDAMTHVVSTEQSWAKMVGVVRPVSWGLTRC